jgi:hypothetical protein
MSIFKIDRATVVSKGFMMDVSWIQSEKSPLRGVALHLSVDGVESSYPMLPQHAIKIGTRLLKMAVRAWWHNLLNNS